MDLRGRHHPEKVVGACRSGKVKKQPGALEVGKLGEELKEPSFFLQAVSCVGGDPSKCNKDGIEGGRYVMPKLKCISRKGSERI